MMNITTLIFVLIFIVYVTSDTRIIGGSNISIDKCSYQLSLQKTGNHVCGATVINKSWALTAAHCIKGTPEKEITLRAGSSTHKSGGTIHTIKTVIMHNSYNDKTKDYDIALLQVSKTFDPKATKAVDLWSEGSVVVPGTSGTATGWGVRAAGGVILSDVLLQVSVPVVDRTVCVAADARVTERQVCAGYISGGKDVCDGDLGGPLIVAGRLLGVAAWSSCGRVGGFGVYTSVPALRSWIQSNTGF